MVKMFLADLESCVNEIIKKRFFTFQVDYFCLSNMNTLKRTLTKLQYSQFNALSNGHNH